MNTFEFEITIQSQSEAGSWPVVVRCKQPDGLTIHARETLRLSEEDFIQLTKELENEKEYGLLLGKALFKDSVRETFVRAIAKSSEEYRLRILLSIEAADNDKIRTLHWERLCAPVESDGGWQLLARYQRIPFSLYISTVIDRRFPTIGRRDLRALVLVASPENIGKFQLAPFDVEAAIEGVKTSLGEIPYDILANGVEGALGAPTLPELSRQLTSATKPYTLLHFICHGMLQKDGETVLYWAQADNQVSIVTADNLIGELKNIGGSQKTLPHFTFLCTCQSADPRAEGALGGLAQRLVRNLGMPAVVAMTRKVSVETALKLGQNFYARLRESGEVDSALQQATAGLGTRYDITVPALFSRLGCRPLFSDSLEDRELTDVEIEEGLEKFEQYLQERAPHAAVLERSYRTQREILEKTRGSQVKTDREVRHDALVELNNLCQQVIEIDFNALAALGKEPPPYIAECPFPGLSSFGDPKYHKYFFGRDELIKTLRKQLVEENFLAVFGASGSGKSSAVLAGLVPKIEEEYLGIKAFIMKPGNNPLKKLERAKKSLSKYSVIVVDQFEELFTLCEKDEERKQFIQALFEIAKHQKVIITIRADFLGECTFYPELRKRVEAQQKLVGPMEPNELVSAMTMQANEAGLRFETGLSHAILNDVEGEPGAMPLLQYALQELWQRRRGRWLCVEEYEAIGKVQQAIAQTADRFYESLPEDDKKQFQNIFLRLTRLDESASGETRRDTRQRVKLEDLIPQNQDAAKTKRLIQQLAGEGARLVVTTRNKVTGKEEVEVAHEALIRHWPRLQEWLTQNRTDLQLQKDISEAAREWANNQDKKDKDVYLIHQEGRLEAAEKLLTRSTLSLNQEEENYIKACAELRDRRRLREKQTLKRKLLAATIGIFISTGAAILAGVEARKAEIRQIQALLSSADASAIANQTLDAKLESVKAARTLKKSPLLTLFPEKELKARVSSYLSSTAYAGQLVNRLNIKNKVIGEIAFSPDGKRIASSANEQGSSDLNNAKPCSLSFDSESTLVVWNRSGQIEGEFPSGLIVDDLAYSPNGTLIAALGSETSNQTLTETSDQPFTLKLWNALNYQPIPLDGQIQDAISTSKIHSMAFSQSGQNQHLLLTGNKNILFLKIEESSSSDNQKLLLTEIKLQNIDTLLKAHKVFKNAILSPKGTYIVAHLQSSIQNQEAETDIKIKDSSSEDSNKYQDKVCLWKTKNSALMGCYSNLDSAASQNNQSLKIKQKKSDLSLDSNAIEIKDFIFNDSTQSLAFSPNEKILIMAGKNGKILVSDPANMKLKRKYDLHEGNVNAVTFSPDERYLLTGGQDNKVFTLATSNILSTNVSKRPQKELFLAHQGDVYKLGFLGSKDKTKGKNNPLLFTAGYDRTIYIKSIDGTSETSFQTPQIQCNIEISPSGTLLATTGESGEIRLWDTTGKQYNLSNREDVAEDYKNIVDGYFDPESKNLITISEGGSARLWKLDNKQSERQFDDFEGLKLKDSSLDWGLYISSSKDGQRVVTILKDGTARLWDSSGKKLSDFEGLRLVNPEQTDSEQQESQNHSADLNSVLFSPDSQRIITVAQDSTARLWDRSGKPLDKFGVQKNTNRAGFSPDSQRIITLGKDGTARLWDGSGLYIRDIEGKEDISYTAFSQDSQRIITVERDGTIHLWDGSGQLLTDFKRQKVLYSDYDSDHNLNHDSAPVMFSPDSRRILTIGEDGTPSLWHSSGKLITVLAGSAGKVKAQFSEDNKYILTFGEEDKTAILWNSKGKLLHIIRGKNKLLNAQFSDNSQLIVTTDDSGINRLWNLDGKQLDVFQRSKDSKKSGRNESKSSGEVSLHEEVLALTSLRDIAVWDTSGQELSRFTADTFQYPDKFSADGKFLLSWGVTRIEEHNDDSHGYNSYFRPYLWRIEGMDELITMNCNWLQDYLENSTAVDEKYSKVCDDLYSDKSRDIKAANSPEN